MYCFGDGFLTCWRHGGNNPCEAAQLLHLWRKEVTLPISEMLVFVGGVLMEFWAPIDAQHTYNILQHLTTPYNKSSNSLGVSVDLNERKLVIHWNPSSSSFPLEQLLQPQDTSSRCSGTKRMTENLDYMAVGNKKCPR